MERYNSVQKEGYPEKVSPKLSAMAKGHGFLMYPHPDQDENVGSPLVISRATKINQGLALLQAAPLIACLYRATYKTTKSGEYYLVPGLRIVLNPKADPKDVRKVRDFALDLEKEFGKHVVVTDKIKHHDVQFVGLF